MPDERQELLTMLQELEATLAAKTARERYIRQQWPIVIPQKIVGYLAILVGIPAIPIGLLMGEPAVWKFGVGLIVFSLVLSGAMVVMLWPGLMRVSEEARRQAVDKHA